MSCYTSRKVRFGVVGCGAQGSSLAKQTMKAPNAALLAVCDVREENARRLSEELNVRWYTSHLDMLQKEKELDALIVTTWTKNHASISMDAMDRGKHVLVEKPMCMNTKEAMEMVKCVERNKVKLVVEFSRRWDPRFVKIKEYSRHLGDLGQAWEIRLGNVTPEFVSGRPWYFDPSLSGGWGMSEVGSHAIYWMNWVMGSPLYVSAELKRNILKHLKADDTTIVNICYENGGVASYIYNSSGGGLPFIATVVGEKGWVSYNSMQGLRCRGPIDISTLETDVLPPIQYFARCILEDLPADPDVYDGLKQTKIVDAAKLSEKLGRRIYLKEVEGLQHELKNWAEWIRQ